jgi:hypothetical protein
MAGAIWLVAIVLLMLGYRRVRRQRRRGGVGTAAAGAVYDWLNEDKQRAVDVIVEERAGARDPEDKDGNLPDLAAGAAGAAKPNPASRIPNP